MNKEAERRRKDGKKGREKETNIKLIQRRTTKKKEEIKETKGTE